MSVENLQIAKLQKILNSYDHAAYYGEQQAALNAMVTVVRRMVGGEDFEDTEANKRELITRISTNLEKLRGLQKKLHQELSEDLRIECAEEIV